MMVREMIQTERRWLHRRTTPRHEFLKLELSGAWEPPDNSGPSSSGEGEETQLSFSYGN